MKPNIGSMTVRDLTSPSQLKKTKKTFVLPSCHGEICCNHTVKKRRQIKC